MDRLSGDICYNTLTSPGRVVIATIGPYLLWEYLLGGDYLVCLCLARAPCQKLQSSWAGGNMAFREKKE